MVFIPQEAKEQIATLMADIDKLEKNNNELITSLDESKAKVNKSKSGKSKTYIMLSIIALLSIYIGYVYMYGTIGSNDDTVEIEHHVKDLEVKNLKLKAKVKTLTYKIEEAGINVEPKDLLYKVQIGAFKSFELKGYSSPKNAIIEKDASGYKKYSLGSFTNYKDAVQFKKEVKKMGFRKAFLVAEYKGEIVTVKEGIKIESKS